MAHDTTINAMSGGDVVVTYDLATAGAYPTTGKVPAGVIFVSPNATTAPTPVTTANPLPVGGTVTLGAGSAVIGHTIVDSLPALPAGTNVIGHVVVDSGTITANAGTGTFAISAASLPLPTGAATSAKQAALGTAGVASADVLTVQGIASMTPLKVDASATTQPVSGTVTANAGTGTFAMSAAALPLPTGAATAAKQPAIGTAGTAATDVLTVQGIASMTALKVDGSAVTQPVSGTVTANAGTGTFTTNLSQVAGTGISLGQKAAASSLPVVLASDQSALQAAQSGTWNVGINVALPAGSNQIGHVVVDALPATPAGSNSIGTVGLNAGANLVGVAIAPDQTGALYSGTTALTPKFAVISASASGPTTIIAAVTSKKLRVLRFSLSANGNVNAKFQSHVTPTDLTGLLYLTQFGGAGGSYCPLGLFETVAGEALDINLSAAIAVGGFLTYVEV